MNGSRPFSVAIQVDYRFVLALDLLAVIVLLLKH